jgi:hypothetical protein
LQKHLNLQQIFPRETPHLVSISTNLCPIMRTPSMKNRQRRKERDVVSAQDVNARIIAETVHLAEMKKVIRSARCADVTD